MTHQAPTPMDVEDICTKGANDAIRVSQENQSDGPYKRFTDVQRARGWDSAVSWRRIESSQFGERLRGPRRTWVYVACWACIGQRIKVI